jgi:hypothetical protein
MHDDAGASLLLQEFMETCQVGLEELRELGLKMPPIVLPAPR